MPANFIKSLMTWHDNNRGFTLTEVIVVMVIVAILATGVVFMFADPTAKVKAAAFEMRGDFNLARAEAVRRNEDVRIDFDTINNGYRIYVDDYDELAATSGPPPQDDKYTAGGDTLVKEIVFRDDVKYYDFSGTPPSNGPSKDPFTTDLSDTEGITLGSTTLTFKSNGTCDNSGSVVVYYPENGDPATLNAKGKPYAVVVDSTSTGNVRLERWRPELGPSGEWKRK